MLFLVYCVGCIYYLLVDRYLYGKIWIDVIFSIRDKSLFIKYIVVIYWFIIIMIIVGYGDLYVSNIIEMVFIIVYMLFNFGFIVYFIGNMINLVVEGICCIMEFVSLIKFLFFGYI